MKKSLFLIEFKHISFALFVLNDITKNFKVKVEITQLICPGRYLIIFSGTQGEISEILSFISDSSKSDTKFKNIKYHIISSIVEDIITKLNKVVKKLENSNNFGIVEVSSTVGAIEIADLISNISSVDILTIKIGIGMCSKGVILFQGSVSDIEFVLNLVKESRKNDLIGAEKIFSPSQNMLQFLKF